MNTNINKDNIKIKFDMNDNIIVISNDIRLAGRGGLAGEASRWVAQGYAWGAARSNPMGGLIMWLRMFTGTATDRVLRLFNDPCRATKRSSARKRSSPPRDDASKGFDGDLERGIGTGRAETLRPSQGSS